MNAAVATYRPLPGRATRWFRAISRETCRLYVAEDHVLHVRRADFTETYRRFYFGDIQALTLYKTRVWPVTSFVLLFPALLFATLAVAATTRWDIPVLSVIFTVAAVTIVLGITANVAFGPTCACRLHTAVHVEALPSLGRMRSARKTFAILRPLIETAQGTLSREDLDQRVHDRPNSATTAPPVAGPWPADTRVHKALFLLLLVDAVSCILLIMWPNVGVLDFVGAVLALAQLIFVTMALLAQRHTDLSVGVRRLTWAILGYFIVAICLASVVALAWTPESIDSSFPFQSAAATIEAVADIVLATLGFLGLRKYAQGRST